MMAKYTPVKAKVMFTEREKQKVRQSGILLTVGDETTTGLVTSIGPDVTLVKEGDIIYLNWAKAEKTRLDGIDYYVIEEDELVAVYDNID